MGVAPIIQASAGIWIFDFDTKNFFVMSLLTLFSYIFFIFGYTVLSKKLKKKFKSGFLALENSPAYKRKFFIDGNRIFLFSILAICSSVILISIYGFHFSSSIISTIFNNSYSSTYQLVEYFVRPLLFFGFSFCIYAVIGGYNRPLMKLSLLLLSLSVFLIIGPLSGARSIIFFLYFGLFIIIFRKALISHPIIFGGLLFFGVFGSELQSVLRGAIAGDGIVFAGIEYFYQGHFDGFEMLGHSVGYVKENDITFGLQLLGAVLFWVPRAIWPDKPIGSGDFVAYEYISSSFSLLGNSNFSMPMIGEAYINFGIVGVCLIFLLVGALCGREDMRFHLINRYEAFTKGSYFSYAASMGMWRYVMFLGMFLFLLRGDLMSGFSFVFGLYTALIFGWLILHGQKSKKKTLQK